MNHRVTALVVSCSLLASLAPAQIVRLPPQADATIRSDQPATNAGGSTELGLAKNKNASGQLYFMRTHFRFDVSSLRGKPVSSAFLYFHENRTIAAGGLPVSVYRLIQGFTESAVTWNSRPAHDTTIVTQVKVGDNFNKGWKKFDITPLVTGWVSNRFANHGLVIRLERESTAGAYRPGWGPSREHATVTLRPYLEVDTSAVRTFNKGCGPVATWPRMAVTAGTPKINTQLTVRGSLLAVSTMSITAIGLSNTIWNGVKLPFMIDPVPGPACQLLVAPDILLFGMTTTNGLRSWTFGVPNDPKIIGLKVYLQMATGGALTHMTEGLELTVF